MLGMITAPRTVVTCDGNGIAIGHVIEQGACGKLANNAYQPIIVARHQPIIICSIGVEVGQCDGQVGVGVATAQRPRGTAAAIVGVRSPLKICRGRETIWIDAAI